MGYKFRYAVLALLTVFVCPEVKSEITVGVQDTNFRLFADSQYELDITVSNRSGSRTEIDLVWQGNILTGMSENLLTIDRGTIRIDLQADSKKSIPISLKIPPSKIRLQYLLRVEAVSENAAAKRYFLFDIYPPADFSRFRKKEHEKKAGVYDPDGLLTGVIRKEGFSLTRIENLQQLSGFHGSILLLGIDILKGEHPSCPIIIPLIEGGMKTLFFTQQPVSDTTFEGKGFTTEKIRRFEYIVPDISKKTELGLRAEGRKKQRHYITPFADGFFMSVEQEEGSNISLEVIPCGKGWLFFGRRFLAERYESDPLLPHILKSVLKMLDNL